MFVGKFLRLFPTAGFLLAIVLPGCATQSDAIWIGVPRVTENPVRPTPVRVVNGTQADLESVRTLPNGK